MVLSDEATLRALGDDGFPLSMAMYRRLRQEMGLYKKVPKELAEEHEARAAQLLRQEYDEGHIEDFGAAHLYTYMRANHGVIRQYARNRHVLDSHSLIYVLAIACVGSQWPSL